MITLLAPSKTLDFTHPAPEWVMPTEPPFLADAVTVQAALSALDSQALARLYRASEAIVVENQQRIASWSTHPGKAALWVYRGDVYKGMYADQLTEAQAQWAQRHILIMSGLYGVVRPYDRIAPYRLEMAAKLEVESEVLADFWAQRLAGYVEERADGVVCCLSSDEYARVVVRRTSARVVTPVFMETKPDGTVGQVPIYSKMMRGVMARWIIDHEIDDPQRLPEFTQHDYVFDPSRSTDGRPVFVRPFMRPLVF